MLVRRRDLSYGIQHALSLHALGMAKVLLRSTTLLPSFQIVLVMFLYYLILPRLMVCASLVTTLSNFSKMVYIEMKSDFSEVWLFYKLVFPIFNIPPLFTQDSPESDVEREKDKKERERDSEKDRARQRSESKHKSPTKKRPGKDSVSFLVFLLSDTSGFMYQRDAVV